MFDRINTGTGIGTKKQITVFLPFLQIWSHIVYVLVYVGIKNIYIKSYCLSTYVNKKKGNLRFAACLYWRLQSKWPALQGPRVITASKGSNCMFNIFRNETETTRIYKNNNNKIYIYIIYARQKK